MKNAPHILLAALLTSCSSTTTPEQETTAQTAVEFARQNTLHTNSSATLEQARSIKVLPVQRQRLIEAFHLHNVPSKRYAGSKQEGVIDHTEAWLLPNGLTLRAYNYQALPPQQYQNTLTLISNDQATSPEQPLFRFFDIADANNKTIYASLEQKDTSPTPKN